MPGLGIVLGMWAYALTHLTLLTDRPAGLLAGAALAAVVLLAVVLAVHAAGAVDAPRAGRAAALRARARHRRVPRQVDPDAAGRPRPRAPGAHPSAA
ncbi:DUF6412 domain-containing protein [Micromonospora peucetia]|uniref:DUF6412 domain-containing protein n=1 Tax=Micromonospora peucetia TaxID=47871 RepID=A0A1C6VEW1_9ACTN|nr:DUF6412 domain-containing protein [Micromonospora peucetia]MCX4389737.1 DUF6412 domain-containing protein [Micromonospora peucetia]WSA30206.1 DUF6412 domain-containing protein [Micromonospora peucetia]SCL64903.1 hypothetical protein GA0070608_3031 [Micromonospora peucetia]